MQPRSENLQKPAENRLSNSMKNFMMQSVQLLKFIMCILCLLTISTFNRNVRSTVMKLALNEIFSSYYVNKLNRFLFLRID